MLNDDIKKNVLNDANNELLDNSLFLPKTAYSWVALRANPLVLFSHSIGAILALIALLFAVLTVITLVCSLGAHLIGSGGDSHGIPKPWYVDCLMSVDKLLISSTIFLVSGKIMRSAKNNFATLSKEGHFEFGFDIDEHLGSMVIITSAFTFLGILLSASDGMMVFLTGVGTGCFILTLGYWINTKKAAI